MTLRDNPVNFRMVVGDGVGDTLQEYRLAGLRLCHDEAALSLAYRGEKVYDTGGSIVVAVARESEFFVREEGGHVLELHPVADEFGAEPVYFDGLYQREILFSLFGRSDDALYRIAGFETECLDLRRGYVDVVRGVKVVVVGRTEETVAVGHDFQNAFALHETDIGIFRSGSVTVGLPLLVVRGGWLMGSGSSDGLRLCRVLRALRLEGLLYCDGYFRSSCRVGRFCGKRLAGCFLRLLYRFAGPAPPWFFGLLYRLFAVVAVCCRLGRLPGIRRCGGLPDRSVV